MSNYKPKTEAERRRKTAREKALRAQRRREKEEGRKHERLLAPIEAIFRSRGYNYKTVAEHAGITCQAVSQIFGQNDDAPLRTIQSLLRAIGLSLTVSLRPPGGRRRTLKTEWDYRGVGVSIKGSLSTQSRCGSYPLPLFVVDYPEDGGAAFLADIIKERRCNLTQFAKITGINQPRLRNIFIHDNIRIREIYVIARALGMRVILTVTEI